MAVFQPSTHSFILLMYDSAATSGDKKPAALGMNALVATPTSRAWSHLTTVFSLPLLTSDRVVKLLRVL